MRRITLSYRRSDSEHFAGRIRDNIAGQFGEDSVFLDTYDIPVGTNFRRHIARVLRESDVVIVIVGPFWVSGGTGRSRIHDADDPVRIEIETALQNEIPIIPVLHGASKMPRGNELPKSIREFADIHAERIDSGRDFKTHVERLLSDIERVCAKNKTMGPREQNVSSAPVRSSASPPAIEKDGSKQQLIVDVPKFGMSRLARVGAVIAMATAGAYVTLNLPSWITLRESNAPYFPASDVDQRIGLERESVARLTKDAQSNKSACPENLAEVDRAICQNATLLAKERTLEELYVFFMGRSDPPVRTKLASDQNAWRYSRNQCRAPNLITCLDRSYDTRIEELKLTPAWCSEAKTPLERAICVDALLATKDRLLQSQYDALMRQLPSDLTARVRDSQRKWLQGRDTCSGSDMLRCVGRAYDRRFIELADEKS